MNPRTRDLLIHLDTHRAALRAAVESVPASKREQKPAPDRWSVAEVLEHLSIVDGRIGAMFAKSADGARAAGRMASGAAGPVLSLLDTERLLDRTTRLVSGEASLPQSGMDAATAWRCLEDARASFRDAIIAADDVALDEVVQPHPRLGSLNMYQWVLFAGGHEGRHAGQIREIAAALG
jgi:hypothetical protein